MFNQYQRKEREYEKRKRNPPQAVGAAGRGS